MGKGFGIGALVLGILSIFVPIVSLYVVWLALALATVAGLLSDKVFSLATIVITLVNVLFLSPATWMALKGEQMSGGSGLMATTIVLFIAAIGALVYGAMKSKASTQAAP